MPFAIVLTFDEKSTLIIEQVFKRFREMKIGSMLYEEKMKPHITLSNYEIININIVKDRLSLFCIENTQFKIQMSSIGYFPSQESVIFLNPKATIELLTVQQKIFKLFKDFEAKDSPLTWVPHCTLGMYVQKEYIAQAIDIIKEEIVITQKKPFYVTAQAISFVKFQEDPLKIDLWLNYKLKE